jgi:hypothetical protein
MATKTVTPMSLNTLLGAKPNRIEAAVALIEGRLATLPADKLESLKKTASLTSDEFFVYQQTQSRAFAGGRLTFDEAQIVYSSLGGEHFEGDWPEGTSLALRITITKLMAELLRR